MECPFCEQLIREGEEVTTAPFGHAQAHQECVDDWLTEQDENRRLEEIERLEQDFRR